MIDVGEEHLEIIRNILCEYVPDFEVRAFGSRVKGTARKQSDLDLVVLGNDRLVWQLIEVVKEAFQDSELPFRVDVLDWNRISAEFREVIEAQYEVIQEGTHS